MFIGLLAYICCTLKKIVMKVKIALVSLFLLFPIFFFIFEKKKDKRKRKTGLRSVKKIDFFFLVFGREMIEFKELNRL